MLLLMSLLAFHLTLNVASVEVKEWKKSLDKDDIIIYTRQTEASPFHEFLAETEMEGTVKKFCELITDFEVYPELFPDCESVEMIKHPESNVYLYHMILKVPFPFTRRDIVQQLVMDELGNTVTVQVNSRPNLVERHRRFVRIERADGFWKVEQISDNKISVKFQYLADPGGELPVWLVNSFIVKSPYKTLRIMREMMQE
jgi:ribosome-associated toxin RatA of RatAB toxin-antitoxin module